MVLTVGSDLCVVPLPYAPAPHASGFAALSLESRRYHVADAVTSISAGIFQVVGQAALPFFAVLNGVPYDYIHRHYALWSLPLDNAVQWVAALILIDFCYYWFHRKVQP